MHFLPRGKIQAAEEGLKAFSGLLFQGGKETFCTGFDVLRRALGALFEIRTEALRLTEEAIERSLLVS